MKHSIPALSFTCTKRRIVDKYRDVFLKRGYIVQDLNFVRPTESNVTYDPLAYVNSYSDITFLAESIVKANPRKDNTTADPYWDDASISLLSALISYVLMTEDKPTFADVLKLNDDLTITEGAAKLKHPLTPSSHESHRRICTALL